MKNIFISGSSDIAAAIIDDLIKQKNEMIYTYNSKKVDRFKKLTSFGPITSKPFAECSSGNLPIYVKDMSRS